MATTTARAGAVEGAQSVLHSIHATIAGRGLTSTTPNVFACLITMLQAQPPAAVLPAVLALLRSYTFRVSPAMIKAKSVTLTKCIDNVMRHYTEDPAIIKRSVRLLTAVLRTVDVDEACVGRVQRLEPHHLNVVLMPGYLTLLLVVSSRAQEQHGEAAVELCNPCLRYVLTTIVSAPDAVAQKAANIACHFLDRLLAPFVATRRDLVLQTLTDLTELLSVHHRDRWVEALQVLTHYFEIISVLKSDGPLDAALSGILEKVLRDLVSIHDMHYGVLPAAVEKCMRAVAMCLDAEVILKVVPVDHYADDNAFRNKYIIDLIRKSTSHDSLAFFVTKMIPLANGFLAHAKDLETTSRVAEARQWQSCYEKIWEMSQAFMRYPRDFSDVHFRQVAKPLVEFLEDPIMRRIACKTLVTIAACAISPRRDSVVAVLMKYSKNILPKLCNLHERERLDYIALAIQAYAQVSDPAVLGSIGDAVSRNLRTSTSEGHMQALIHVAVCIASVLPTAVAEQWAADTVEAVPRAETAPLEKQYYHLLAELAKGGRLSAAHMVRITDLLIETQTTARAPCRKFRVALMVHVIEVCPPVGLRALAERFTPEVIVCVKEPCTRSREGALRVVQSLARILGPLEYLRVLQAGLGGKTPIIISGTLIAVAKLFWCHHRTLPDDSQAMIQTIITFFVKHPAAEIRNAAFSFLRMLIKVSFRDDRVSRLLLGNLPALLEAAYMWVSTTRVSSSTRQCVRVIVEKLIKRYGEDAVTTRLPEAAQRYGNYVIKMMARRERMIERLKGGPPADDFGKYFFEEQGMALREDDEALDLTEPSVIRNLTLVRRGGDDDGPAHGDMESDDDDEEFNVLIDKDGRVVVQAKAVAKAAAAEKREREGELDDDEDREERPAAAAMADRKLLKVVKRAKVVANVAPMHTGEEFGSKDGGGDMKKANRPDPYAYVPLDRKLLNKRFSRIGKERLQGVSARRGSKGGK